MHPPFPPPRPHHLEKLGCKTLGTELRLGEGPQVEDTVISAMPAASLQGDAGCRSPGAPWEFCRFIKAPVRVPGSN